MMCPYGRRTLVLLGAGGVGRRTLKAMLLSQLPNRFATVVPCRFTLLSILDALKLFIQCTLRSFDLLDTSRISRSGEQEGREYYFETKEGLREMIRNREMVEWGELGGHIYGTSIASVRNVVR